MSPATWPRDDSLAERLLWIDPKKGDYQDARVGDLSKIVRPGDLLVVNDAATLPASLKGVSRAGHEVELRLISAVGEEIFDAILFGAGDWRTKTEDRPQPPPLSIGDRVDFAEGLSATIEHTSPNSPRLVTVRFDRKGAALFDAIYRVGKPIQYAYLKGDLELWHTQTRYASRPWAMELCSAGRPLTWGLILDLRRRGIRVATLTHAAGISSTGDPAIDRLLPMPERFEIPDATVRAIRAAKAEGGRVIAIGTTVARALEGCAALNGGEIAAGTGITDLILDRTSKPRVVDGLFTGMHDPTASHFHLMEAFVAPDVLLRANAHAEENGYLCHEFGDSTLILAA